MGPAYDFTSDRIYLHAGVQDMACIYCDVRVGASTSNNDGPGMPCLCTVLSDGACP